MGQFYLQYEYWIAVFQLVTAMLGMGATLTIGHFRDVFVEPKAVSVGILIQVLMVPLVAYAGIHLFGVVGGVAVGLALIAAIPGGTTSNIFTHFAKGNIALSITITAVTTLACLVTTPIILDLLITQYMPQDFVMPRGQVMQEIAWTLLLPMVVGMSYLRYLPSTAELFSKWCVRASLLGIALIVIGSSASGRLDPSAFGYSNIIIVIIFIGVLALAGLVLSRLMGLSRRDATAVEMEVVVRNINLGVLIKASLFPAVAGQPDPIGDTVLFTLIVYGTMQMLIAAILIASRRRANG